MPVTLPLEFLVGVDTFTLPLLPVMYFVTAAAAPIRASETASDEVVGLHLVPGVTLGISGGVSILS